MNLVISDIILPGMNGIELCKQIKEVMPNVPILMLTALGTTDDKLEGFDAGADDYMTKPFDFRELLARIGVLLRRTTSPSPSQGGEPKILTIADLTLDIERHECTRGGVVIHLSPKEFALLQYLLENAERVVSRSDIQENVWHTHFDTGTFSFIPYCQLSGLFAGFERANILLQLMCIANELCHALFQRYYL